MKFKQINEGSILGPEMDAVIKVASKSIVKPLPKTDDLVKLTKKLYRDGADEEVIEKAVSRMAKRMKNYAENMLDLIERGKLI